MLESYIELSHQKVVARMDQGGRRSSLKDVVEARAPRLVRLVSDITFALRDVSRYVPEFGQDLGMRFC
jgi:hypothetical protein